MSEQLMAFPPTALEAAELFAAHFEDLVERRQKSVISANDKLTEAEQLRDLAERQVLQAKAAAVAADIVDVANSGAMDSEGITVTAVLGSVDPVTGEVEQNTVSSTRTGQITDATPNEAPSTTEPQNAPEPAPTHRTISADVDRTCHECGGEGRLPDRTGGGHHRCRECDGTGSLTETVSVPIMLVAWPGNPDMQHLEVGPLTRYGELAARFLNALPSDDPRRADAFTDYRILCVDTEGERDPHAVIVPRDYGLLFSVEAPS